MKTYAHRRKRFAIIFMLSGLVLGCTSEPVKIKEVYASNQCALGQEGVRVVETMAELNAIKAPRARFDAAAPAEAGIDFEQHHLIVVAMGSQPSSGYGVVLADDKGEVRSGGVHLAIEFQRPSSDKVYAQMMTSPCLVVALPKGSYNQIIVRNKRLRLAAD